MPGLLCGDVRKFFEIISFLNLETEFYFHSINTTYRYLSILLMFWLFFAINTRYIDCLKCI